MPSLAAAPKKLPFCDLDEDKYEGRGQRRTMVQPRRMRVTHALSSVHVRPER